MKVELVKLVLFFKSQSQILVGEVFIKNYENIWEFLAVQNSSIGDLVPWLVLQSCLGTAKKPKRVSMCAQDKTSIIIIIRERLNNICVEESNCPVDDHKHEREQGVVHKGKPKC